MSSWALPRPHPTLAAQLLSQEGVSPYLRVLYPVLGTLSSLYHCSSVSCPSIVPILENSFPLTSLYKISTTQLSVTLHPILFLSTLYLSLWYICFWVFGPLACEYREDRDFAAYSAPRRAPGSHRLSMNLSFFKIYLFIYFWLHWVFVAARGLSLVAANRGYPSLRCAGISLW